MVGERLRSAADADHLEPTTADRLPDAVAGRPADGRLPRHRARRVHLAVQPERSAGDLPAAALERRGPADRRATGRGVWAGGSAVTCRRGARDRGALGGPPAARPRVAPGRSARTGRRTPQLASTLDRLLEAI